MNIYLLFFQFLFMNDYYMIVEYTVVPLCNDDVSVNQAQIKPPRGFQNMPVW